MLYEMRPPQFEAVQWDGTLDGFESIRELIRKSSSSVGYFVKVSYATGVDPGHSRVEFDFAGGYIEGRATMYALDYMVLNLRTKKLEIVGPEEFKLDYNLVSI